MGLLRLSICISGVYATFLLWAIAQERLVSVPFPSTLHPSHSTTSEKGIPQTTHKGDLFPSPLFLNYVQSLASTLSAFTYLLFGAWKDGSLGKKSLGEILGWSQILGSLRLARQSTGQGDVGVKPQQRGPSNGQDIGNTANGVSGGIEKEQKSTVPSIQWRKTLPALLLQVSIFQTMAGPIGFLALRHISYPTMVLGKSCKLIPVMLLNVLLYRRRFSPHKYLVVGLVTLGISLFMLFGEKKKKGGSDSVFGFSVLLINLFIDGLTNSTQDQLFSTYPSFTGQQMMFFMSLLTQLLLLPTMFLPFPSSPLSLLAHLPFISSPTLSHLHTTPLSPPAFFTSTTFLLTHPTAIPPLLSYALLGGLGQLFIFETIQHFGSLTLVMVTVTRKLFTMLLSVFVFGHVLRGGQWVGIGVVFLGIGVEAGMKRLDLRKKIRRD